MKKIAVVITGGSKGIGKSIAFKFADQGFQIITCARNTVALEQLKLEIEEKFQVTCHTFKADCSKEKEIDAFASFIQSLSISINVLVNNTGFFLPGTICEEPKGQLEIMLNTNLMSAYHLTRHLAPLISNIKNDYSRHIFNIVSVAGIQPYANGGAYSISKYALMGFSENLREELKEKKIRVSAVIPGAVYTASWEFYDGPQDRLMPPEDIANMIWHTYNLSPRTVVENIILRPQLGDL